MFSGLSMRNVAFLGSAVRRASNAILQWLMTEGSGSTLNDSSGNGDTGTQTNCTWESSGAPGGATYYLSFNGSNSSVASNSTVSFKSQEIVTLDFYFYNNAPASLGIIAGTSPDNSGLTKNSFYIYNSNGGVLNVYMYDNASSPHQGGGNSTSGVLESTWHHLKIVLNFTNGTAQAYVDGGSNVLSTYSGTWSAATIATRTVTLGILPSAQAPLLGYIALFQIFEGDTH